MSDHGKAGKQNPRSRKIKERKITMSDRNVNRNVLVQTPLPTSHVFQPSFDTTNTPIPDDRARSCEPDFSLWDADELSTDFLGPQMVDPRGGGNFVENHSHGTRQIIGELPPVSRGIVGYRPVIELETPPTHPVPVRRRTRGGQFAPSSDGSCNGDEAGTSIGGRNKKKKGADVSWIVTGPMEGGPEDGRVIPSYGGHVARDIWCSIDRGSMKLHGRPSNCVELTSLFSRCSPSVQARIRATGLSHLPATMYKFLDMPLLSAFIERWQPDTNSFHMPFGEMSILLHDVKCILDIPIDGTVVSSDCSLDSLQERCAELFGMDVELFVEKQWNGGNLEYNALKERCVCEGQSDNYQFLCYMLMLLTSTLFVDKSGGKVRGYLLPVIMDHMSWGAATLANLYQQLGIASRAGSRGMYGCCTLLQAWIYEYFPMFRPRTVVSTDTPLSVRASRWSCRDPMGKEAHRLHTIRRQLDSLQAHEVEWMPYGTEVVERVQMTHYRGPIRHLDIIEPYMPDRVIRQLGYVQGVPQLESFTPDQVFRAAQPSAYRVHFSPNMQRQMWSMSPYWYNPNKAIYPMATTPSECSSEYLQWFKTYSHPIIVNPNGEVLPRSSHITEQQLRILSNMMHAMEPFAGTEVTDIPYVDLQSMVSTMYDFYEEYKQGVGTQSNP